MILLVALPSAHGQATLDLNAATAAQLELLPSVGPVGAAAFLEWRAAHGPCASLDELSVVPGFGTATLRAIASRAVCGDGRSDGQAVDGTPSPGDRPANVHAHAVDINRAGVEELMQLPGIPEVRARAIVRDREQNGPFAACADLVRVPGIGPATVANLDRACVASLGTRP